MSVGDRVLYEDQRSDDSKLIVSVGTFREVERVDCRLFWLTAAGEWMPSKKGITIPMELVPDVIQALQRAIDGPAA